MKKLTRHERLKITYAIDDTLESYCRADCPHANQNTPSPVCTTCPISIVLQEYGDKLNGVKEKVKKPKKAIPVRWKKEDDEFLIQSIGKLSTKEIAKKLKRTETSVYKRATRLKLREKKGS